jgi:type IV fimbrial biogenesis protein FimT
MISVVLLGIVLSLALPSYRDMVEKRQLTQGAEQIFAFLNAAQGVASRSNSVVTVSYSLTDTNDWCMGAILGETPCDCSETTSTEPDFCSIDGGVMRLTNDHVGNNDMVDSVDGDGAYAFDPIRGLLVDLDDSVSMVLQSPSSDYQLRLSVSNTGHTSMCSVDADHHVPGFPECPPEPE